MKTVKRVDKLTAKQTAAMAGYAQKWIDIGLKTGDADWATFDKYMPIAYEKAGLKYPKNIVRVQSPLIGALAASIAEGIMRKGGAVHDAIGDAVDGAIGDAVHGAIGGAVHDAIGDAIGDAVRGAIGGAVHDAIGDAVDGAVHGAVHDAVDDAIGDAIGDAVRGAIGGAVHDAIGGAVHDAIGGAVDGAVHDAIGGAVDGAVHGAIGGAVDGAVHGAVHGAISLKAGAMTSTGTRIAIEIKDKLKIDIEWHCWLGGQFWVGYWWRGVAYVNFMFDVCGLKLPKDIMERAEANRKISESVNYIWPNKHFVIVCDRPKEIHRNAEGRLHNVKGLAIKYGDGWGLYFIHGVKFTEEQFTKTLDASITDIIAWEDIDQRSALLRERPVKELLENVPKKIVDHSDECGGYDLWEIELKDIGKARVLAYTGWSSEKEYIKFAKPTHANALQAIAEMRGLTEEELKASLKS